MNSSVTAIKTKFRTLAFIGEMNVQVSPEGFAKLAGFQGYKDQMTLEQLTERVTLLLAEAKRASEGEVSD